MEVALTEQTAAAGMSHISHVHLCEGIRCLEVGLRHGWCTHIWCRDERLDMRVRPERSNIRVEVTRCFEACRKLLLLTCRVIFNCVGKRSIVSSGAHTILF